MKDDQPCQDCGAVVTVIIAHEAGRESMFRTAEKVRKS